MAQSDFTAGSYELVDGSKGTGQLKYEGGSAPKLWIKDDRTAADPGNKVARKGLSYTPDQVRSFRVGKSQFLSIAKITLDSGIPMTIPMTVNNDFAQLLDSGKVELLSYQMYYRSGGHFGRPSDAQTSTVYLIRRREESAAVMIPVMLKKYRATLATYLGSRPEVLSKLNKLPKSEDNLHMLIREYNAAQ